MPSNKAWPAPFLTANRQRQQIRTRETLYEESLIFTTAKKKKVTVLKIKAQQIHSWTDWQYCFWLDFLYQNHANNLCLNSRDLHSSEKIKTPVTENKKPKKIRERRRTLFWFNSSVLDEDGGGEGKRAALGQLRWCKLSNSTNKTAKRFLKAFKLPCELWLPAALEGKLITHQTKQTNMFHIGSDLQCYVLSAPSDKKTT